MPKEEITREEIKNTIQHRVLDAIRILCPNNEALGAVFHAFQKIDSHTKNAIFDHAASLVHTMVKQERVLRKKTVESENADEADGILTDFHLSDEGADDLGEILQITAWTKDRAINEALHFMRKALQFDAASQ
jgi:hypothetical protein